MLASVPPLPTSQAPSASVVVITDVDGILLRHDDTRTLAEARPTLERLSSSRLVLCSSRSAEELRELQRHLGIRQPFISKGGAALHIPHGYFFQCAEPSTAGPGDGSSNGYETIDFGVRRLGHAVRLLIELFRTCPEPPLVVGIGFEWHDRVLLHQVDVPVVIRDPALDQSGLLRNVPNAYLTDACGNAGVAEVMFGDGSVGRA